MKELAIHPSVAGSFRVSDLRGGLYLQPRYPSNEEQRAFGEQRARTSLVATRSRTGVRRQGVRRSCIFGVPKYDASADLDPCFCEPAAQHVDATDAQCSGLTSPTPGVAGHHYERFVSRGLAAV